MTWHLLTLPLIMVFFSATNFLLQQKSFLMALMSLEALMLTLTFFILINTAYNTDYFFVLVVLTAGTAEAAFALALLARMTFMSGNDNLNTLTMTKLS